MVSALRKAFVMQCTRYLHKCKRPFQWVLHRKIYYVICIIYKVFAKHLIITAFYYQVIITALTQLINLNSWKYYAKLIQWMIDILYH